MTKGLCALVAVLLFTNLSFAASNAGNPCQQFDVYGKLLHSFLHAGRVDYNSLSKGKGLQQLEQAVKSQQVCSKQQLSNIVEAQQLAFWINAYNLLTLKVVAGQYPIKSSWFKSLKFPENSIRQINGAWTDYKFDVAGRTVSLDDIEHKILRREYQEPRIHFAINCASIGCPVLRPEPYRGLIVDVQLDDQVKQFVSDSNRNFRIDAKKNIVYLSRILDWFSKDFFAAEKKTTGQPDFSQLSLSEQAVIRFLLPYLSEQQQNFLLNQKFEIEYIEYDWTLNEQ